MEEVWCLVRALLLLAVANTAPLLAKRWMGSRWNRPLDAGGLFNDGRPWLGPSKTWRGVIAASVASALAAPLLGLDLWTGVLAGLGAMAGDALSSFTKRRLGVASSGRATGLDQVPEALLPLWLAHGPAWFGRLARRGRHAAVLPVSRCRSRGFFTASGCATSHPHQCLIFFPKNREITPEESILCCVIPTGR